MPMSSEAPNATAAESVGDVLEHEDLRPSNDLEYLLVLANAAMLDNENFDSDHERALWAVSQWCQEVNVRPNLDEWGTGEEVPRGEQRGEHPRHPEFDDNGGDA